MSAYDTKHPGHLAMAYVGYIFVSSGDFWAAKSVQNGHAVLAKSGLKRGFQSSFLYRTSCDLSLAYRTLIITMARRGRFGVSNIHHNNLL